VAAAGQVLGIAGVSGFASHESLLDGMRFGEYTAAAFCESVENTGDAGKECVCD